MRLWTIPLRLLGILALAALVSGAWLFRQQIVHLVRPAAAREEPRAPASDAPQSGGLASARDKIDSLHGWSLDSVVLTPAEVTALVLDGLPPAIARQLDSLALTLGQDRIVVTARLATAAIPRDALGPLAGALAPWERFSAEGPVVVRRPGAAEWRVESLTLRGFTLPEESSRALISRALPGVRDGAVPLALPRGVAGLRIRPAGASLYREGSP